MSVIGFIGSGNMAEALVRGIISAGKFVSSDIMVSDIRPKRLEELKERYGVTTAKNTEITQTADIIVLSVKPQMMSLVLKEIKGNVKERAVIVSIAAGITVEAISDVLGEIPIIRVMPNTPALISEGMSGLYSPNASDETMALVKDVFSAVGKAVVVDKEDLIDAVTAISGSGPAYYFLLMEEMTKTARQLGLSEETAVQLVLQTAKGASSLAEIAQSHGQTAEELRMKVTSPGGTTEAAVNTFKDGNFSKLVSKALTAAYHKSKELSNCSDHN